MMHRRDLLHAAVAAGGASLLMSETAQAENAPAENGPAENGPARPTRIVDTNISLFQWPFRRLPLDAPDALVNKLRSLGITEAWASSFEGILHRDIAGVNQRLADACKQHSELTAIGSVNLALPDWEHDFSQCVERYDMPGVRLHPNYHGYTLADPRFQDLLQRAESAGRFVQIAVAMEDTRTQHRLVHVADVDLAPLPNVMREREAATIQILSCRPAGPLLDKLAKTRGIYFDTSRVDGTDGLRKLLRSVPRGRVMFGTHAPFLIPEAALIRTVESDLKTDELRSVLWSNSRQMRKALTR